MNWLIGYLAMDVRTKWNKGTLFSHRDRYRADTRTKAVCSLASTALVAASLVVVIALVPAQPVRA
ncbi:hypothetical protein ALI144C_00900 [Actinosynnema sp. ALI-1.44]|uniref:hypothetical protein n=1 Tax=Actinosynnema sp. ALI-1.44 TaxID=1933779 RepID=UPI00097C3917|nr:hypothetical protein [Actinosynnema sp. ALI-1.44]ONI91655.1 hypothetical protein ALI144C_00900 [Actinosynnema sp. ALI-1.44]